MLNDNISPLERVYAGSRIKILVLSRVDIGEIIPEAPYIVISISDPEQPDAAIIQTTLMRAVLRLKFHDNVQTVDIPGLEGMSLGPETEVIMTQEDARSILAFVREHLNQIELIVCQCEAGISRSAGIAAALSRILQGEDQFFFDKYWPNRWVYRTILDAE